MNVLMGMWGFARKVPVWIWLIMAGSGLAFKAYGMYRHEQQQRVLAELALVGQKQLNDSTAARLALSILQRDSVGGLLDAAHKLNGKLVAALRIHVAAKDTLVAHDTLATTMVDSVRRATFVDSTFAGTIAGTITAPPAPAPLGLTYTLTRPAFDPEVGFVRVGDRTVAVVTWRGEKFTINAPYAKAQYRLRTLGYYFEGLYGLAGPGYARAGGILRAWHGWSAVGSLERGLVLHATPKAYVGLRWEH